MFKVTEDVEGVVLELDDQGITFLLEGLTELRHKPPGEQLTSNAFVSNEGEPIGMTEFVLRRK